MNTVRDPSPLPREHVRSTRADPGLHMHVRLIQTRPPQRVFILDTRYSILDTQDKHQVLRTFHCLAGHANIAYTESALFTTWLEPQL
jgi:hypothetical protein